VRFPKFSKRNLVKYLVVGIFVITFLVVANAVRDASTPNGLLVLTLNIVNQNAKLPSTNYVAELFDYSSPGQTTLAPVAVAHLNAGDSVSLYDNSISSKSLTPLTPVHYSLLVTQQLSNGSVLILLNYDWSSSSTKPSTIQLIVLPDYKVRFIMDGKVVPFIVRTPYNQTISVPANSTTVTIQTVNETYTDEWPITTLSNSQTPNSPALSAAYSPYTTQALIFYNHYPYYYVYTNGATYRSIFDWPVLFTSNRAANCAP